VPVLLAGTGYLSWGNDVTRWAAPLLALVFLAVTGGLLVADLKHPERFYLIFTRHHWRSWLVRGAVVIGGCGAVAAAYLLTSLIGASAGTVRQALGWAGLPLALADAVYTAYLFAQAKGRDLWQSPLLAPHLAVQATLAGAAAVLPLLAWLSPGRAVTADEVIVAVAAGIHVLLVAGEVLQPHVTAHARLAVHELAVGSQRLPFGISPVLVLGRRSPHRGSEPRRPPWPLPGCSPRERWDDWVELSSRGWPKREEKHYTLVPTTCFNCESACGLLAYVDRDTGQVRKFEGNPEHPGSRGRNCAKGPATLNQVTDPDRILYPLRRSGPRGGGQWERVSWDEVLDALAARIAAALLESRQNEVMVHIGRPGEDGFTERVLASWGVDGHNSHTNVCSSGGRTGFQFWMGIDRPSPDHANANVIYLISAHLESGHYFNPHAQRITEARANGAKVIVLDTRLSNTATHADYWLPTQPGSEAAVNLAIANHLIRTRRYDREFMRRWWNWAEYLTACHPDQPVTFGAFEEVLSGLYAKFTFEFAAAESGIPADTLAEIAEVVAGAGHRFSCHSWRSAAAGNLGGWQVSRTLFLISALLGAVATEGGTFPNAWNKFVPCPIHVPPHPGVWQELSWPLEYPLAQNEMSFLLPHFLKDGRGRLDTYFSRVYNPLWTNPDGLSWMEVLRDESLIGCFVALTPTWNESAYFADYVLPMGLGSERHDTHSYEQYDGQWVGFRQPVLREARSRRGELVSDTRDVNPGEVWEENEFWIELSWRIDPDGSLGIRQYYESVARPGEKLTVDEYYGWMFEHSVPGLPERAAAEGLTPLAWMRRYGAFEVSRGQTRYTSRR
jgi:anaerobic selenocysteine-containing dehydrogenase